MTAIRRSAMVSARIKHQGVRRCEIFNNDLAQRRTVSFAYRGNAAKSWLMWLPPVICSPVTLCPYDVGSSSTGLTGNLRYGSVEQRGVRQKKRWVHLLWTLPLAFVIQLPFLWGASISMCGVSGCSGGGFGVTDVARGSVLPLLAVAGFVLAIPVMLTPWHPRWAVRVAIGLGVAMMWLLLNASWVYSML